MPSVSKMLSIRSDPMFHRPAPLRYNVPISSAGSAPVISVTGRSNSPSMSSQYRDAVLSMSAATIKDSVSLLASDVNGRDVGGHERQRGPTVPAQCGEAFDQLRARHRAG